MARENGTMSARGVGGASSPARKQESRMLSSFGDLFQSRTQCPEIGAFCAAPVFVSHILAGVPRAAWNMGETRDNASVEGRPDGTLPSVPALPLPPPLHPPPPPPPVPRLVPTPSPVDTGRPHPNVWSQARDLSCRLDVDVCPGPCLFHRSIRCTCCLCRLPWPRDAATEVFGCGSRRRDARRLPDVWQLGVAVSVGPRDRLHLGRHLRLHGARVPDAVVARDLAMVVQLRRPLLRGLCGIVTAGSTSHGCKL